MRLTETEEIGWSAETSVIGEFVKCVCTAAMPPLQGKFDQLVATLLLVLERM